METRDGKSVKRWYLVGNCVCQTDWVKGITGKVWAERGGREELLSNEWLTLIRVLFIYLSQNELI